VAYQQATEDHRASEICPLTPGALLNGHHQRERSPASAAMASQGWGEGGIQPEAIAAWLAVMRFEMLLRHPPPQSGNAVLGGQARNGIQANLGIDVGSIDAHGRKASAHKHRSGTVIRMITG